jgi:hypothetical protein
VTFIEDRPRTQADSLASGFRRRSAGRWPAPLRAALGIAALLAAGSCSPVDNGNGNNGGSEPQFLVSPDGRAVAIVDPDGFTELVDLSWTEPRLSIQPLVEAYLQAYAERFPSDANFLLFLLDVHRDRLRFNALGGFNVTVRSPETGLGPIGQATPLPNLPELRSYIYLARKDSLVLGPSLHELAHAWGVRLTQPSTLGKQVTCSDNHWGYTSAGGQLGGWSPGSLVENSGGRFEIAGGNVEPNGRPFNTVAYSHIELYLMGLVGSEAVPAMEVAINPQFQSLFQFTADDVVVLSIEDILDGNGVRKPLPADAPRDFKLTVVFLTDHIPTSRDWAFYADSMNFFEAPEARDIQLAFPARRYRGEPIRDLIQQSDPENPQRHFMNFFEATAGLARVAFIDVRASAPAGP